MMMRRAALALAMVAAAAAPAFAQPGGAPEPLDEPDPIKPDRRAVEEASEANLEPESRRQGLAIGVAVGPSMQVGFDISESTGTGGSFAVRFGTVASPRWVWLLELATTAYRKDVPGGDPKINQSALFTLGGQLYVKEAFWLRGGGGPANFTRRTERAGETTASFWGFGVIGAGGLDVMRRRSFAVSLEALTALARYRDGYVAGGTLQLGLSWY
jgi:hypothetical protein